MGFFILQQERNYKMSVQNPDEGKTQAPTGGVEQPTSQLSDAKSQPLPEYVKQLQSQIADLTAQVKGVQGSTDKQVSGLVRGEIKRILELKDQGLNEEQIKRELWIDQQIQGQSVPAPQQPAGSGKPETTLDVEPVLKSLQFAENDAALAALKIKYQGDPKGLLSAAADLRLSQLQSPSPSPAMALSQTGQVQSGDETQKLQAEYEQRKKNIPRGNILGLSELQAEFRKRGLPI